MTYMSWLNLQHFYCQKTIQRWLVICLQKQLAHNLYLISHALTQEKKIKKGKTTYFHALNVFKVLISSSVFHWDITTEI